MNWTSWMGSHRLEMLRTNWTSWMGSHGLTTSSFTFLYGVSDSVERSIIDSISSNVAAQFPAFHTICKLGCHETSKISLFC